MLGVTGLLFVATGSAWWSLAPPARAPAPIVRLDPTRPPVDVVQGQTLLPSVPAAIVPARPTRVVVPTLGVDAPVVPVRAPGGTLAPPSDPFELGWWAAGPEPGGPGVALITGHTVHDGPAALNDLARLRPGDVVDVRTEVSVLVYRVVAVRRFSKGSLARRAQEVFATGGPSRLALVTCSDWDGQHYLSNTVVTAVPASA